VTLVTEAKFLYRDTGDRSSFSCTVCVCQTLDVHTWQTVDIGLKVRGEIQNCSVLYCVLKLCTVISTLR